MTPAELLAAARNLIGHPDPSAAGSWARTGAFLARQALENAVDAYLGANPVTGPMRAATMRSKLTCLPVYLDQPSARQVAFAYRALSRACHYHPYELAPSTAELRRWIDDVEALVVRLT